MIRQWRASHTSRVPLAASGAWVVVVTEAHTTRRFRPQDPRGDVHGYVTRTTFRDRWQAFRYDSAGERIAAQRDAIREYDAAVARGAYSASLAEVERSTDY